MAQVTSYPYQLSESILAPSPTEMWNDPILYEDILPPRKAAPINSSSFSAVPAATPAWRPARVFPSEKYVPPCSRPPPSSSPSPTGTSAPLHRSSTTASRASPWSRECPFLPANHRKALIRHLPACYSRITMIDYRGFIVYDTYVRPTYVALCSRSPLRHSLTRERGHRQPVSDYRTAQTGLTPYTLARGMSDCLDASVTCRRLISYPAPTFPDVQQRVANLVRGKILVGYSLWEFLSVCNPSLHMHTSLTPPPSPSQVMGLSHPAIDTRDTALFLPFRRSLRYKSNVMVPLVTLVNQLMARNIGLHGEHPVSMGPGYDDIFCSPPPGFCVQVEHARAAMDLFRSSEKIWEGIVAFGSWPTALPPDAYANCFN